MKLLLATVLLVGCIWAQPQMVAPQEGMMLDHSGALRPLIGMAQTFTAGEAVQTGVLSAACGKTLCVVRTDDFALISIEGDSALIYFQTTRQFARLRGDDLQILDWAVDGEVLALRGDKIVVKRSDGVRIVTAAGAVVGSLPDETVAVILLHDLTIFSTPDSVVLRRPDGTEMRFNVAGVVSLSQMNGRYVQAATNDETYAIRFESGKEQIALLPEVKP